MIGTLASPTTGLLRNSLLNQLFPKEITDAFLVAYRVPNLFRELLAEGALTNSFVPIYKSVDRNDAKRLSGALLGLLILVNGLLLLLAYWTAPWVATVLISNRETVDVALTVRLTRIVFPFLSAISFSALAMGILNAEERFLAPAWAPVALNVVTVTLMALFPAQAVPLATAFVLGGVAQLLVQLPALARHKLLPKPSGLWHPALPGVLLLMIPFALTTSGRQVLNVVSSRVLTSLERGSVTAFSNADLFLSLALGLFSISPALAYYSRLSDNAVKDPEQFPLTLLEGLRLITFLTVPAGLALWLLAEPAVQVVFNYLSLVGRGLDEVRLGLSVAATAPLGLAVFPIGIFNLLVRTFYVRKSVRIPITVTMVFLALQALLYWQLAVRFGIVGMSWATVAVGWSQCLVLLLLVRSREELALVSYLRYAATVWSAAGLATVAAWLLLQRIGFPAGWWGFFGQTLTGLLLLTGFYVGAGAVFGLTEVRRLFGRIRR
jgi:putative peptidoglycan lipid II flippase